MKRFLKILHELGSIGLMGALAANIVLVATSKDLSPIELAAMRRGIEFISKWLILPSLALVLMSGLLASAITSAFHNAGWVWIKALLAVMMMEGTLGAVQGTARDAAQLSAKVAAGTVDRAVMDDALRHEWGGLWTIMVLSLVNVVLAVWRPRFTRRAS